MSTSQHPIDRLIRAIVDSDRSVSAGEIAAIVGRMANAPFNEQIVPVHRRHRGLRFRGRALDTHEQSLFLHLALRVVHDAQWASGTTEADYLADLQTAVADADARLALFRRRGGYLAATLGPNHLPPQRQGGRPERFIFVVYSVDRSRILSGYQVSGIEALGMPEDARWLK